MTDTDSSAAGEMEPNEEHAPVRIFLQIRDGALNKLGSDTIRLRNKRPIEPGDPEGGTFTYDTPVLDIVGALMSTTRKMIGERRSTGQRLEEQAESIEEKVALQEEAEAFEAWLRDMIVWMCER